MGNMKARRLRNINALVCRSEAALTQTHSTGRTRSRHFTITLARDEMMFYADTIVVEFCQRKTHGQQR